MNPYPQGVPRRRDGRWVPSLLVAIYFLSVWKPGFFQMDRQRWYMAAGLAVLAFCWHHITRSGGDTLRGGTKVFWAVCGTSLLGALMSLLRAHDVEDTVAKTITLAMNYCLLWLFVPVLATALARRVLLVTLVLAAGLWSLEIWRLLGVFGKLYYSTFAETGADKNLIGFNLVLAGISLLCIAVFWRPARMSVPTVAARLFLAAGGIAFWYHMGLIYARSGVLAALLGAIAILIAGIMRSSRKTPAILFVVLAASMAALLAGLILPSITEQSPQWSIMYAKLAAGDLEAVFFNRPLLLRKGLYLIGENPLVGIGAGGSLAAVTTPSANFPRFLIHNTYLTAWAEYGILGLLSNVIWVAIYVKGLKCRLLNAPLCDQVWLLLFIPLFFQMSFMEMNTVSVTMLAILAGILSAPLPKAQTADLLSEGPTASKVGVSAEKLQRQTRKLR